MSSTDNIKNKLVNSMKMTKQGTAKTTTATEKKEEPKLVEQKKEENVKKESKE